ncbi:ThiF family adenylyltransferase [Tatumella ptyseos]|uniref:ThiF family adenylyltransferase n=1 Tax=Tatumella ptyseos TaxID=82987 RepID=UPI0026EF1058|nr:ThiF family adenylyltransferase [Tatumella ptyseos]WKX26403.1 ThiF family adenylyltransferase [Tatumella ptyseos]
MQRYQRQMQLPEIGEQGQRRLQQAKVLVVGAGGLSATLLPQLVGAGIGQIRLYDADRVALHNLHRQTLFTQQDVGKAKALCAQAHLSQCNSEVLIEPEVTHITASIVREALRDIDIVVDAADNFATTYLLSDACLTHGLPLISASVLGTQGYVGGFCGGAPSYKALFPHLPATAGNCQTAGVMGPVVACIAAAQAQMVLSWVLQSTPSPLGLLVKYNFSDWQFNQFRFDSAEEPIEKTLHFIDRGQLLKTDLIVELRDRDEAPHSVTDSAVRVPLQSLHHWTAPSYQRLVLVCRTGLRSARAERLLRERGLKNIVLLAAGEP